MARGPTHSRSAIPDPRGHNSTENVGERAWGHLPAITSPTRGSRRNGSYRYGKFPLLLSQWIRRVQRRDQCLLGEPYEHLDRVMPMGDIGRNPSFLRTRSMRRVHSPFRDILPTVKFPVIAPGTPSSYGRSHVNIRLTQPKTLAGKYRAIIASGGMKQHAPAPLDAVSVSVGQTNSARTRWGSSGSNR